MFRIIENIKQLFPKNGIQRSVIYQKKDTSVFWVWSVLVGWLVLMYL